MGWTFMRLDVKWTDQQSGRINSPRGADHWPTNPVILQQVCTSLHHSHMFLRAHKTSRLYVLQERTYVDAIGHDLARHNQTELSMYPMFRPKFKTSVLGYLPGLPAK